MVSYRKRPPSVSFLYPLIILIFTISCCNTFKLYLDVQKFSAFGIFHEIAFKFIFKINHISTLVDKNVKTNNVDQYKVFRDEKYPFFSDSNSITRSKNYFLESYYENVMSKKLTVNITVISTKDTSNTIKTSFIEGGKSLYIDVPLEYTHCSKSKKLLFYFNEKIKISKEDINLTVSFKCILESEKLKKNHKMIKYSKSHMIGLKKAWAQE